MSRKWIGFGITIVLSAAVGQLTTYIMDPGATRLLTSLVAGFIIGIVGWELSDRWERNATEGPL